MIVHPKQVRATEAQFLKMVMELANILGWKTAHFRPALTARGWRTAVQGDGKGFPDLVMVKDGHIIFAELKVPPNKLTREQDVWIESLGLCWSGTVSVFVWTPDDWPEIEKTLRIKS